MSIRWPLSYITWNVRSVRRRAHKIEIYDSTSSRAAPSTRPTNRSSGRAQTAGDLTLLRVGTEAQPVLGSCGDDHRINWGYAYAAAPSAQSQGGHRRERGAARSSFVDDGDAARRRTTRGCRGRRTTTEPVLAFAFDLGRSAPKPSQRQVIVAYDEIYAIKYFGKKLRPYWARNGANDRGTVADGRRRIMPGCWRAARPSTRSSWPT